MPKAIDVCMMRKDMKPQGMLKEWMSKTLHCNLTNLKDLRTGAMYCQILHRLFPTAINLSKIRFYSNLYIEYESNFKQFQAALDKVEIDKIVPVVELMAGRGHYDFCNWLYKLYMANDTGRPYDALLMRKNSPIGVYHGLVKEASRKRGSSNLSLPVQQAGWKQSSDIHRESSAMSPSVDYSVVDHENVKLRQQLGQLTLHLEHIGRIIQRTPDSEEALKKIKTFLKLKMAK